MPNFTVCIQETGNPGATTYVTAVEADTKEQAIELATEECRADWGEDWGEIGLPFEERIHILAVFAGDVEVLHWEDQCMLNW